MTVLPSFDERRSHGVLGAVARGVGQILVTAGVVIVLFVGYELWWTGLTTRHDQRVLLSTLQQQWKQNPAPAASERAGQRRQQAAVRRPALGSGFAILRIPRLGKNYKFVIIQGTSTKDLIKGPGHYPNTALPGQVGNFAVAGHRTTYLHPFYDINELRPGDAIVIETRTSWFTYRVGDIPGTSARYQEIVRPTDVSVAYPVPDQPESRITPTLSVLTLTSCNPRYSAAQRIVVHALLTSSRPNVTGAPPGSSGNRQAVG